MKLLNEKYDYGLNLVLLSVDEGITGYRDDSLETVKRNKVCLAYRICAKLDKLILVYKFLHKLNLMQVDSILIPKET